MKRSKKDRKRSKKKEKRKQSPVNQIITDADNNIQCSNNSLMWILRVVAAVDKFTHTTEILWRKRDGMATL